ncbi:hypothetical protein GUJ93_ZPchr0013g34830 [Zizania palustris]|uniref:Uncharacterized protein n=1 Tax=Zizania palustris TaxID=103762 RepID=A0A8J6C082_ZIZPA|nr:hypothetical protein GUJ93_ZPchr0013g34830 [Zizania palustris]
MLLTSPHLSPSSLPPPPHHCHFLLVGAHGLAHRSMQPLPCYRLIMPLHCRLVLVATSSCLFIDDSSSSPPHLDSSFSSQGTYLYAPRTLACPFYVSIYEC